MHANPKFEFPFKYRIQREIEELQYILQLIEDYEVLINQGLNPETVGELLKTFEQKYLTRKDYL